MSAPHAVSAGGGAHLVALLDSHGDAYVMSGRPHKRHKLPDVPKPTAATEPGTPYNEVVLCALSTCKVRSYEPPRRPPPKPAPKPGTAPDDAGDMDKEDEDEKPLPPRKPSELLWRMPHCFIKCVEQLAPLPNEKPDGDGDTTPSSRGFVVVFFSKKSKPKGTAAATIRRMAITNPAVAALAVPYTLRAREYVCTNSTARDEWLLTYHAAVTNYWHERLENTVMAAPEVYQYHEWGMDAGKGNNLIQVALSTTRLYGIARQPEQLENDIGVSLAAQNGVVVWTPVADIQQVTLHRRAAVLEVAGKKGFRVRWQLFTTVDAVKLVVELQRVWDAARNVGPGAADDDAVPAMPVQVVE